MNQHPDCSDPHVDALYQSLLKTESPPAPPTDASELTPISTLLEVEKRHIIYVLVMLDWHVSRAAVALDIDRRTLYRKMERFGIQRPTLAPPPSEAPLPADLASVE